MKCAVYYRVSTHKQTTDSQRQEVERYVSALGWEVVGVYEDLGMSGARDRRPGLEQLLDDARRRRFRAVVVAELSRLGRSLPHLIRTLEVLRDHDIAIISLRPALDTSTREGRIFYWLLSMFSDLEREWIADRVRAGIHAKLSRGGTWGRRPLELPVKHAAALLAGGKALSAVARDLGVSRTTLRRHLATTGLPGLSTNPPGNGAPGGQE